MAPDDDEGHGGVTTGGTTSRGLLAGLALLAATAPAAGAAVRVEPSRVTVTSGDGRVEVQRSPFALRFADRSGRTTLETFGGARRSRSLPPTFDPEPFHLVRRPDRAFPAAFGVLVGSEQAEQWTGSYWAGNVFSRRRQGRWHAARRVVDVRRSGSGVRLVVATTDRSRRLVVRIRPARGGFDVAAAPSRPAGVASMTAGFASGRDERWHGLGGRHDGDHRGQVLPSWIEQENFGGAAYTTAVDLLPPLLLEGTGKTLVQVGGYDARFLDGGAERAMFPGGPGAAYSVNTHLVSSRGYGLTLDQPEYARWRLAADRPDAWSVDVSARRVRYRVVLGPARRVVATQTARTGRHRLPPRWAHGATLWRLFRVNGSESVENYRQSIERDLADIERLRPPLTAYSFESWALLPDDYVRATIARLRKLGIRTILYQRAYFAKDVLATQPATLVDEVVRRGLVAKDARGRPHPFGVPSTKEAYLLDFTNPEAVALWERELRRMLDLGADGFMQDFGEATLDTMRFANGETGRTMHNRYPVLYHRATRRVLDEYEREKPGRGAIYVLSRAGFTGSARYETSNFPGDETTNWSSASGLRSLVPDLLNRGVGGQFGFTTDIGGYSDLLDGPPDDELFTRWSELSALTPFFRVHNSANAGTRRPWDFAPATYGRWLALSALHDRATPLIRRLWREARRTGIPPLRPLWLDDPSAARVDQQFLLGEDVLVAPVVVEGATSRAVRFPRGCWQRPDGSGRTNGPATRTVAAPLGELPYFFRCGTRPF